MQGVINSAHWGGGYGTGAFLGGLLYNTLGPISSFCVGASVSLVACCLALRIEREDEIDPDVPVTI